MAKRYSEEMFKRVKKITTNIFNQALRNVLGLKNETPDELQIAVDFIRTTSKYNAHLSRFYSEEAWKEMSVAKEAIDELYLKGLISLPTKTLEEILFLHEQDKIRRADRTLECIISEIARRVLLTDTAESDSNTTHGDMDETRTKISKHSKKASK